MPDEEFDPQAMIRRFHERAQRVRERAIPPVAGPERQRYIDQAKQDHLDFALIGDAEASLVDGVLTLRIDLRPAGSESPRDGA